MNKASLLQQLKIDRDAPGPRRGPPIDGRWVAAGLAGLALIAALAWWLIAQPDRVRVQSVEARAVSGQAAAQGGSLLDASGYVIPQRQATVSSKITGKVLAVLIEEGQRVEAGQIIARLDDSNARAAYAQAEANAAAAQANVRVAKVALDQAGPRTERRRRLHESGYLSEQAVEDAEGANDTARYNHELAQRQAATARAGLEMARRNLDDTIVRAPFAGVVTVKAAQPGEMVSPISAGGGFTRTGIGTIVDMDSLEVVVDVAENFISRIRQGMPATITLNAYPDLRIPGEVIAVVPTADRSKATVAVRVGLKTRDPRVVPEMGARVSFLSPATPGAAAPAARAVAVPAEAVRERRDDRGVVFVIDDGRAERRAVRLGPQGPEGQIITAGVAPGERLALGGGERLRDGARVRVTERP